MKDYKDYEEFDTIIEKNGYYHYLDHLGRTIMVEGDLRLENGKRNLYAQRMEGGDDRRDDDDGFHIIATRFGGWGGSENLICSDRLLNRGHYKRVENEWAEHLNAEHNVHVKIEPLYVGDETRPYCITGEYTVSGADIDTHTDYISWTNENLEAPEFDLSEYDDFYPYAEEFSDVEDVDDVKAQEIDETNADTRDVEE